MAETTTTQEKPTDFLTSIEALASPVFEKIEQDKIPSKLPQDAPKPPKPPSDTTPPDKTPPAKPQASKEPISDSQPAPDEFEAAEKALSGDAKKNFAKFRQKYTTEVTSLNAKVKDMEAKLAKASAVDSAGLQAKLDALAKERDELVDRVRRVDLEHDDKFQAAFSKPKQAAIERAKKIVGVELASKIESALALPPSEYKTELIAGLTDELTPVAVAQLGYCIGEIEKLEEQRVAELANAKTNMVKLQELKAAELKKSQEAEDADLESAIGEIAKNLPMFQTKDGDDAAEWNRNVQARVGELRQTVNEGLRAGGNVGFKAKAAALAMIAPALIEQNTSLMKQIEELNSQLGELKSKQPDIGGKPGETQAAPVDDNATVIDRIIASASNQGAVR